MNLFENYDFEPMLLKEKKEPFDSKDYLFELKFDGIRALIFASPNFFMIRNRHHVDITFQYPELEKIKELVSVPTIFDGEIVLFSNGVPSFSKLQERAHLKNSMKIKYYEKENPVVFVAFDILFQKNNLINLPLLKRKELLHKYEDTDYFVKSFYIENSGIKLFKKIKKMGWEGIVAKEKNSVYEINTRSDSWLKIKNLRKEIFYIGGYLENATSFVFSLLLGEYKDDEFYYVGKVSVAKKNSLYSLIKKLKIKRKSYFVNEVEKANYVEPIYSCYIEYLERSKNNMLRQPVYKGYLKTEKF